MVNNERQIKPLRSYDVHQHFYRDGRDIYEVDQFTADDYEVVNNADGDPVRVRFFNTGNVIRDYSGMPVKIIITPVE